MSSIPQWLADTGQWLGAPEMNWSENLSGSNTQTKPSSLNTTGFLGEGGYVVSPVPGGTQNWPVSGGVAQGGPQIGKTIYTNPPPQNSGQILGEKTQQQNTNNGNGGFPDFRGYNVDAHITGPDGRQYRNNGTGWELLGGQDGGVNDQQAQVDAAYNAGLDVLNQQENELRAQQPAQEQYIVDQYGNLVSKVQTEGEQLTADTQTQQSDFNTTVQNALQEATRAYTALKQQIMARFGFGSSAGQGANDIASQEYYRTMGQNQQEGIRGTGEFSKEFGKIKTYVAQKTSDLDLWKTDTLNKLKQDLSDKLNQIATAKSTLIGNKAYATMQVMQNAVQNAQAIVQQDRQYRQQLAADAINNMQQVSGRAFSPAEIKATLASFGINVPGGQVASSNPTNMYKITGRSQDEINQATNPYGV